MNKFACIKLLSIVTQPTHGVIVFKQHFKDESAWSEAFMDNVSTKVFDYNEHLKKIPEDVYIIENYEVKESCKDNPLIHCKHFTVVNKGDKLHREDKFVGKVGVKYDEDYNLIHVWFSTNDNDDHYMYLGCVNKFDLEKYHGVSVMFAYKD